VVAVYQCQLGVPSLRGRLTSNSESWGVNGHTTRCISPVSVVLRLRLVSGRGLRETEISAALWALRLGKGLYSSPSVSLIIYVQSYRQTTEKKFRV